MRVEMFDPGTDAGKGLFLYHCYLAGQPRDDPGGPVLSQPLFTGWITTGWDGTPREAALAAGDDGAWAGGYVLELPDRENTHLGRIEMYVAPDQRRRGYGTALLRHAAGRLASRGRTVLSTEARIGSDGWAFAATTGARPELIEVRRVLELADVPAGRVADLRGKAEAAAGGYSLVRWQGPTPLEYLDQVTAVIAAMADAPRSPGQEPERDDPERIRRGELTAEKQSQRRYSVAARCDRTGELAALTQMGVDAPNPQWGHQLVTAVLRAHRGHRLGMLVKVDMLDVLAGAEPGIQRIATGNAGVNRHMIAINDAMGFKVESEWQGWELAVPAAAAAPAPAEE